MNGFCLTFVTRSGCHLCEQAEPVVRAVASRSGATLDVVDVDTSDDLLRLYALRIPVVLGPGGDVLAEGIIDRRSLRRAVSTARRRW